VSKFLQVYLKITIKRKKIIAVQNNKSTGNINLKIIPARLLPPFLPVTGLL